MVEVVYSCLRRVSEGVVGRGKVGWGRGLDAQGGRMQQRGQEGL